MSCQECEHRELPGSMLCPRHRARQRSIIAALSARPAFIPRVLRLEHRRANNKRLLHVSGPSWAR